MLLINMLLLMNSDMVYPSLKQSEQRSAFFGIRL